MENGTEWRRIEWWFKLEYLNLNKECQPMKNGNVHHRFETWFWRQNRRVGKGMENGTEWRRIEWWFKMLFCVMC